MNVGYLITPSFLMPECITQSLIEKKTQKNHQPSKFPLSTTSFSFRLTCQPISPRGSSHLPPSSLLLSSCNLVPHPQIQGALQRQSFLPPVLRLLFQRLKKQTHVNLADGKPRFLPDLPTHLLGDLGQIPTHHQTSISSSVKWDNNPGGTANRLLVKCIRLHQLGPVLY